MPCIPVSLAASWGIVHDLHQPRGGRGAGGFAGSRHCRAGTGCAAHGQQRALIRKLAAVEKLGSTSVICTDKTGTLTVGEMTVRAFFVAGGSYEVTGEGYASEGEVRFDGKKVEAEHEAPLRELATILLGCNNAHLVEEDGVWKTVGDPTEGALLAAGLKAGGDRERIDREMPKHHTIPFDSDRKLSGMIRRMPDGKLRAFINGALDVLLDRCTQLYTNGHCGYGAHLRLHRPRVRRTPAILRCPQHVEAGLAHSAFHQPPSSRRRPHFVRSPGVEPAQRGAGPLPENLLHAIRRLLSAADPGGPFLCRFWNS